MKSPTKLWPSSTFPPNTQYNNAMNKTLTLSPEHVAEMFKLSPLHKKLVEFFKPERYDGIFKNIINAMINDVGLIKQAERLDTLFVWEETEQGYGYWHDIHFEFDGRVALDKFS